MPASEQHLLSRAKAGDQAALGQLVESYQHRLFNVALRMVSNRDDAAEVTQDALLKVIEHLDSYNGTCALSTWMIRITMNLSISHLRKRRLRLTTSLDNDNSSGSNSGGSGGSGGGDHADQSTPLRDRIGDGREPGPAQCVQQHEMIENLHRAIRRLDEEFRSVLVLRDIEEMDYTEIAEVLSIPAGTVKSRLFRARLALRQELSRTYPQLRAQGGGAAGTTETHRDDAKTRV